MLVWSLLHIGHGFFSTRESVTMHASRIRRFVHAVLLSLGLAIGLTHTTSPAQDGGDHAALLEIDGPIGPATSDYVARAHKKALQGGARLIILRIDTPGGLDTAMRDIIKTIMESPIPVVAFVQPGGARAASAGTYILYASHIAAMAPATSLGAATPVRIGIGAPPTPPGAEQTGKDKGGKAAKAPPAGAGDAMERKVINDAVAFIRGLAERRGRNADWAERAVREGESLSSPQALKLKVIDLIASDLDELLTRIDAKTVETSAGKVTLSTSGMKIKPIAPDWRSRFLTIISSPTVAIMLMLIGVYGLLFEGMNPGAIVPGVMGGICLLLGLFALQAMPINYVGAALIVLGIVLMIAEGFVPSFGALGFGGIAALAFGAVMLVDTDVPGFGVNRGVIAGMAVAVASLMALSMFLVGRTRRITMQSDGGVHAGTLAEVIEFHEGHGWARVNSEHWRITSNADLQPGQQASVSRAEGLTLHVKPIRQHHPHAPKPDPTPEN
jgi:membrane-bound serine protease (ClpP class)